MKPIPADYQQEQWLEVSSAMTVDFEQDSAGLGALHPVYSTYWLTKHMEMTARSLLLPFLEEGDEGIGFEVQVRHLAPALPGMQLRHVALFRELKPKGDKYFLYADAEVHSPFELIAKGSTTQVIMPQEQLQQRFAALRARWEEKNRGM